MTRQELLNERLRQYIKAEETILAGGQSYTIGDRTLTRADLKRIQTMIESLLNSGAVIEGMEVRKPRSVTRVIFNDC